MSVEMTSNKPYLVKAFYDWLSDNDLTPHIVVDVSLTHVMVPQAYVQNGEIVLNISQGAVGAIALTDRAIEFSARFGGVLENLYIPYGAISAIYAKENGVGTALPIEEINGEDEDVTLTDSVDLSSVESGKNISEKSDSTSAKKSQRPTLKVVK